MIALGIETSCDETGVGIIADNKIRANIVREQLVHSKYGGVVPELAARDHIKNIVVILNGGLEKAGISIEEVDLFSYTCGPGLLGPLLVGATFTKALGVALGKPTIGVSHIESHIFSITEEVEYPILFLVVSGGHTELILARAEFQYDPIGTTIDDACGEAFDKAARILGLSYPGGPEIERLARQGKPGAVKLPMPRTRDFDFSFSGLKTAVLYYVRDHPDADRADIALSFQKVVIDYLIEKALKAAREFKVKTLGICGGVSANRWLRERFLNIDEFKIILPDSDLTTDNGVMVARCGLRRYERFGPSPLNLPVFATKKGLL
ncbi:MAG TPA: tRNA (adenosine(37)-N6)-threonylcarbamoyltransferase complex transferase subunit TsaD [bacterium (Candidatus Stahlbacteria)]|nr:tRNA (adenosine(37)-N6)-threonylcarbamoyltransferase complex transferase subunit TsaD [Candidatus Stahlbacteria bacterium]